MCKNIQDLRKVNYSFSHAKDIIMDKQRINESLKGARRQIQYMTKVKTKTDLQKCNIQKDINKMKRQKDLRENQAIFKDPAFITRAQSAVCQEDSVDKYMSAEEIVKGETK